VRLRDHELADMVRSAVILHDLDCLHNGVAAYFVWASPPHCGCTTRRHVPVHRHTTAAYPSVADAMIGTA